MSQTLRISLLLGGVIGLGVWLYYGLYYGLSSGLSSGLYNGLIVGLSWGLSVGLSFGLSYWAIIGFWSSLARDTLDSHQRIQPNEGIRRSGRNGLLVGLIAGSLGGLINTLQSILVFWLINALKAEASSGLSSLMSVNLSIDLIVAPLVGLIAGLLAALLTGGLAWLQHYLLRVQLWRAGVIPWRSIRFLDEATGCILLRKVGGGYSFVHRLLLDYFASLNTGASAAKTPPQAAPMASQSSFADTDAATS